MEEEKILVSRERLENTLSLLYAAHCPPGADAHRCLMHDGDCTECWREWLTGDAHG